MFFFLSIFDILSLINSAFVSCLWPLISVVLENILVVPRAINSFSSRNRQCITEKRRKLVKLHFLPIITKPKSFPLFVLPLEQRRKRQDGHSNPFQTLPNLQHHPLLPLYFTFMLHFTFSISLLILFSLSLFLSLLPHNPLSLSFFFPNPYSLSALTTFYSLYWLISTAQICLDAD